MAAKAGIHWPDITLPEAWDPAFAGVTEEGMAIAPPNAIALPSGGGDSKEGRRHRSIAGDVEYRRPRYYRPTDMARLVPFC
jgi:hypothetical protein